MASGDTLLILTPLMNSPPGTSYATLDIVVGVAGSGGPAQSIPVLDYDDTTSEIGDFYAVMPQNYSGGGLTAIGFFSAAQTAANVVQWEAGIQRFSINSAIMSAAFTFAFATAIATAPTTLGMIASASLVISGSALNGVLAGEYFLLRWQRNPTPGSGTDVTGDASLHAIHVKET